MVLIALPMLTEPQFARSVVYLLEADPGAGSVGVVINVPTRTPVAHVLPEWADAMTEPSVIFRGGPVQADGALCLAQVPSAASAMPTPGIRTVRRGVLGEPAPPGPGGAGPDGRAGRERPADTGGAPDADAVGLVDLDGDVAEIRAAARHLRVFAGHAGWGPGQLESEIDEGAWAVVPGRPGDVFTGLPRTRWADVLRRQPPPLRLLASYPPDPTQN